MIYLCIVYGLVLGFLAYSSYFALRVSKGLPMWLLYKLVIKEPVEDDLLFYTFSNLFYCRLALISAWLLVVSLGVTYYVQL